MWNAEEFSKLYVCVLQETLKTIVNKLEQCPVSCYTNIYTLYLVQSCTNIILGLVWC